MNEYSYDINKAKMILVKVKEELERDNKSKAANKLDKILWSLEALQTV